MTLSSTYDTVHVSRQSSGMSSLAPSGSTIGRIVSSYPEEYNISIVMERQCQMILLCGYLGSGKTTLIREVLSTQREYKVAVIQNEFSDEMGIESPLMRDSADKPFDKLYEMPNGCLCCSAKTDMIRAIEFLIA